MLDSMPKVSEERYYPRIEDWLSNTIGYEYTSKRKYLWGKQPDIIGLKFEKAQPNRVVVKLCLVEVKVLNSLDSVYNLIGEMEVNIANFYRKSFVFGCLHPYLAVLENNRFEEIRSYAKYRGIGVIRFEEPKGTALVLEREPETIDTARTLSLEHFRSTSWIKDKDEAKIFGEAIKTVGWWRLRKMFIT